MAAEITEDTGLDVELEVGRSGEFTVWVDDEIVSRKTLDGFPTPEEAARAVAARVTP